jgi:Arc/MetJ family transcription regulator
MIPILKEFNEDLFMIAVIWQGTRINMQGRKGLRASQLNAEVTALLNS